MVEWHGCLNLTFFYKFDFFGKKFRKSEIAGDPFMINDGLPNDGNWVNDIWDIRKI